ncbi:MAG TPA: aminotransferase class I/II-fold pyridoxal phosphate-dependent enzyme [Cellulomonas sp.]
MEPAPATTLTRSVKWSVPDGWIGAGIAESDFGTAPEVVAALQQAVAAQSLTYLSPSVATAATEACAAFLAARHGWSVPAERVHLVPDVLTGLRIVLRRFIPPGAPVVVPTPAYMPFLDVPVQEGHPVIQLRSRQDATGRWAIDLDGLARAFAERGAALLLLCNPHNPLGQVMTAAEQAAVRDVVERAGARVFSDEIHAPVVYPGGRHLPYATLDEVTAAHTVTATSISKGWNAPGLKCAQVVLTSDHDQAVWVREDLEPVQGGSMLGAIGARAAYLDGVGWLDRVLAQLRSNRDLLADLLAEHLPEARWRVPDATYLAWLDLGAYRLGRPAADVLAEQAHVVVTPGAACGTGFDHCVRLNFAMPPEMIERTLTRLALAVRRVP